MTFVTVVPQLRTIRGQDRFTYRTDLTLQVGEVVVIPWRTHTKTGVVVEVDMAEHPGAKAIARSTGIVLPPRYLTFLHWLASTYQVSEPAALLAALPDDLTH